MHQIKLSSIAETLHINVEYLSRTFKKEVGVNFSHYLNNLRLKKAIILLVNTDMRISEIAINTGYQNFSYFSKCFRKAFDTTPIEYRSLHTSTQYIT